jgi:hypothetical protein
LSSRVGALFPVVGLALLCASEAHRIDWVRLADVVADARTIFVGRVIEVNPVEFDFDGSKHTCGFRYTARAERTFKGPTEAASSFFDPSTANPLQPKERFAAFVFWFDVERHQRKAATLNFESGFLRAQHLCQLPWIGATVKEVPRTLIRLPESTDWIEVPPYLDPGNVRLRAANGRNQVSWEDIARRIRAASRGA